MEEPHVWGTLTKHDSVIFHDNDFEVFIDPDGDNHEYYEIEINALNTEWDLFLKKPYRDGGPAINEWEIPGLKTAVARRRHAQRPARQGPSLVGRARDPVEGPGRVRPPARPAADGDQWRVNFSRVEWQHDVEDGKYRKVPGTQEDNWVWSPQGVIDMHRPERWGFVQFSTATPGTASYRPDPASPIRDRLIDIYHAQNRFRAKNKRWAGRIEELDLPAAADASTGQTVELRRRPTATRPPSHSSPREETGRHGQSGRTRESSRTLVDRIGTGNENKQHLVRVLADLHPRKTGMSTRVPERAHRAAPTRHDRDKDLGPDALPVPVASPSVSRDTVVRREFGHGLSPRGRRWHDATVDGHPRIPHHGGTHAQPRPCADPTGDLGSPPAGRSSAELAAAFGLPPRTVRGLLQRGRGGGPRPSRRLAPAPPPSPTPGHPAWAPAVLLRREHPAWGAGLIRVMLRRQGIDPLPDARTLQRWFAKAGLGPAPQGRRPSAAEGRRATRPHETWQVDAAEDIGLGDGSHASWLRIA